MARYPVTVAQFRAFIEDSHYDQASPGSLGYADNHPAMYLTWHTALVYCSWLTEKLRAWPGTPAALLSVLNAGGRVMLPSEAEWEKAARGGQAGQGLDRRI